MPSAFGKPVTTANRFGAVATPSAWTLVTTLTASNSASLTVTGLASTSYKNYALLFSGWLPATSSDVEVRFSTDNGATYPTTSTDWYLFYQSGPTTVSGGGATGAANGYVFDDLNNASKTSGGGTLYFTYGVVGSARSQLFGMTAYYNSSSRQAPLIISASFDSSTEVNAMKFQMTTGNITNGTIKVYGIT